MVIKTDISVLIIYISTYIPIYIYTHKLAPEVINQQIITNLNTIKKIHGL